MSYINVLINKPALLIMATCMLLAACKKQTCTDVVCPANTTCINGTCRISCGPHQVVAGDTCRCDTNWIGNCDIPIGLLAGRYHVKGSSYSFSGSNSTSMDFETDVTIERSGDTLFYGGYAHTYAAYMDTTAYFPFVKLTSPGNYSRLRFKRTLDDSIFYDMQTGGMGGGTGTGFIGTKLH